MWGFPASRAGVVCVRMEELGGRSGGWCSQERESAGMYREHLASASEGPILAQRFYKSS